MGTGITTSIVAAAIAALSLAAGAPAKPTASASYDVAALEAMGGRYQAMADHYLGQGSEGSYSAAALKAMAGRYQAMAEFYGVRGDTGRQVTPDGYQPQLHTDSSDVISRFIDRSTSSSGVGIGLDRPDGYQPQLHGPAGIEQPDGFQPQLRGPEAVPVSGSDDGFDWRIFGIATGSALLLATLGGGALAATRTRGRVAHP